MAKKAEQYIYLPKRIPKSAQNRYFKNLENEKMLSSIFDSFGHINGQHRYPVGTMHFGRAKAGGTACEVIAIYNVLKDIGKPSRLADLIFYDEVLGFMFLSGHFGTKIHRIGTFLDKLKVPYERLSVRDFIRSAGKKEYDDGQIFIVTIKTRAELPISQLHTFETVYYKDNWIVYNRFNDDEKPAVYKNAADILRNGKYRGSFYSIYRINNDSQNEETARI